MKKAGKIIFRTIVGCVTMAIGFCCWANASYATESVKRDATQSIEISEANFPDLNFRTVILERDYDRDGNGVLDAEEIGLTINIYCEGMGIQSLQGVEFFTALQGLWCKDNMIGSMDLSKNKELHGVWCSGNPLVSLDFSANPVLEWVYCYDCKLMELNVSNNHDLSYLECNTNPLRELDVTHNPLLEHLTCGSCELTTLDLSKNPKLSHLDAFRNHFTTLDVSHNPKLKRLDIWDNPGLGSIDLSHNPGLQYYNCANNDAGTVDVGNNPELLKLICSYNHVSELDLSHNPKLVYLDCAVNQIDQLDLTNNTEIYFLQAFTNSFRSLDIGNNRLLVKTYQDGVKRAEYDVCQGHSWSIDYGGESSTGEDNMLFLCIDDAVTVHVESNDENNAGGGEPGNDVGGSEFGKEEKEDFITRELVAQTLYEMAGSPNVKGLTSRFTDVREGAWYENALLWGEKNSICVGSPDVSSDTFGVGEWIKRQDLALMLMRYAESMNYKRAIDFGRSDDFADYYDIDYYAWEAICWATTWNIMIGKGDPDAPKEKRRIDPHGNATRLDFETMLKRMLEVNGVEEPVKIAVGGISDMEGVASQVDGNGDNVQDVAAQADGSEGYMESVAAQADGSEDNVGDDASQADGSEDNVESVASQVGTSAKVSDFSGKKVIYGIALICMIMIIGSVGYVLWKKVK